MKTEDQMHRAAAMLSAFASGEVGNPANPQDAAAVTAMANLFCWILHEDCPNAEKVDRVFKRMEAHAQRLGFTIVPAISHDPPHDRRTH